MNTRISSSSKFMRVLTSMTQKQLQMFRAQEQISTGRRINRPSDDPTGTARVLLLNRRLAQTDRFLRASDYGAGSVNTASAALQDASDLYSQARSLIIQAMSGALSDDDRAQLATEASLIRDQLLEIGSLKYDNRYLFAGSKTGTSPWETVTIGGRERVVYAGGAEPVEALIGDGLAVPITGVGADIFAQIAPAGLELTQLTGLQLGTTANEGTGYEYIDLRHDSTDLSNLTSAGLGITSAGGGSDDTFLGDGTLTIDSVAGTIQLGSGEVLSLPDPTSPEAADFVVTNENGGELHLDLSGYLGGDFSGTVSAAGSISIDGSSYVTIDFAETDLELVHPDSGAIVHVDLTEVSRAGRELAQFGGTTNVFDLLTGLGEDLLNADGLNSPQLGARLEQRLAEMDRNQDDLLNGLVAFGAIGDRLAKNSTRLTGVEVQLEGLRSGIQDADISEAILQMAEAESTLELAQAAGVRTIQTSLLNFIR